jgi:hypothetical protein
MVASAPTWCSFAAPSSCRNSASTSSPTKATTLLLLPTALVAAAAAPPIRTLSPREAARTRRLDPFSRADPGSFSPAPKARRSVTEIALIRPVAAASAEATARTQEPTNRTLSVFCPPFGGCSLPLRQPSSWIARAFVPGIR